MWRVSSADLCMYVQDVGESILCHSVVANMPAKGPEMEMKTDSKREKTREGRESSSPNIAGSHTSTRHA